MGGCSSQRNERGCAEQNHRVRGAPRTCCIPIHAYPPVIALAADLFVGTKLSPTVGTLAVGDPTCAPQRGRSSPSCSRANRKAQSYNLRRIISCRAAGNGVSSGS
jgi:hypothetical protein